MCGESIGVITFDFPNIERPLSRSIRFRSFISRKGSELGHVLLLDPNRKSHMESPTAPSHLILSDLVRSKSRSLRLEGLYVVKLLETSRHLNVTFSCLARDEAERQGPWASC